MNKPRRRIIRVKVPQAIWDADQSWWNMLMGRDIMGAWMESIKETIKQIKK